MRKTTKLSPQAALHPRGRGTQPRTTAGDGASCLTYTLSLPDLTIVAVDASDGITPPAMWLNKPITAAWPQAAASLTALAERAQQTRHPAAASVTHLMANHTPASATCLPIVDAAGALVQLLLTLTIPAEPAMADAASEPRELMRIMDHLPVGVLWTDQHGQVKYQNAKQQSLTDVAMGAPVMPDDADLPHPRWLNPATHEPYRWGELPLARTLATGVSAESLATNGFLGDADEQVVLIKAQPILDENGVMTDIIAIHVDLTAQYHAEQDAVRHAATQDAIIDGMLDGLIIFDRHGTPIRYNRAALQILGWAQAGLDPLRLSEAERMAYYEAHLVTDGGMDNITWPMTQVLAGNQSAAVEATLRQADGAPVIVSVQAITLRDPMTQEITGAATLVSDITKLRQLDYMKDEFMSVASHELRTPLTSLLLASRLMQRWLTRSDRADDLRRLADDMANQVKRMDRLINNMLDLTRINAQHFAMVTQAADLTQMICAVIAEQRVASGRAITYSGVQVPIPVEIDCVRMQQVLANVLSNAVKYDPSMLPIEVTMTLSADGRRVVIAVHDHGFGITSERLPHLFEQNYRAMQDQSDSQSLDGLGLSLYICQAIVERHKGKIWAESTIGQGSTFYIDLPARATHDYYDALPLDGMQHGMAH